MKSTISVAGIALLITLSGSTQAETIVEALQQCSNEQNDLKRLMCFDALTESMHIYANAAQSVDVVASERNKTVSLTTAPQAPAKPVPAAPAAAASTPAEELSASDDFGLEAKRLAEESLPKTLSAMVSDVTETPRGDAIVTLNNGMIWRQTDKKTNVKVDVGDSITIERGVLGSFYLGRNGQNSRMAVRRIK